MSCKLCSARADAHFGWCTKVGGPGRTSTPEPPAAPPPPSVDQALFVKRSQASRSNPAVLPEPDIRPRIRCEPVPVYPRTEAIKIAKLRDQVAEPVRTENIVRVLGREPDWTLLDDWDLETCAAAYAARCATGLPDAIPYTVSVDVMAMEGFVPDEIDNALRHPERVVVRAETQAKDKRYPVLSFRRGDVNVILGMRLPYEPRVIAAYWTSLLSGYDPTAHRDRTGGGGSKEPSGLPKTVSVMVKRLVAANVNVDPEWQMIEGAVSVSYDGQDLGKITVGGRVSRDQVQADYQRIVRKVHAIDQKAGEAKRR